MRAFVFSAAFAALVLAGCAVDQTPERAAKAEPMPARKLTGRVVDAADILSREFEDQLSSQLEQFEKDTRVQLVVATTPNLEGENVAVYTRKLGNAWGVGNETRDDGLILLVAPNERKTRIEVGNGLEEVVTNAEAQTIIDVHMLPKFRNGNFEAGIDAGVNQLMAEVTYSELKDAA